MKTLKAKEEEIDNFERELHQRILNGTISHEDKGKQFDLGRRQKMEFKALEDVLMKIGRNWKMAVHKAETNGLERKKTRTKEEGGRIQDCKKPQEEGSF